MFVNNVVYIFFVVGLDLGINLVTFVDAAAVLSTTNSILDKFNNLATLATIPSSCNDTCNAIEATISDCMTVQCVCTSSNEAALNTCVDCLEAVKPNQTVISQAQDILNQYAALCDAGGISVPVQTASGFSGSVGLPLSTTSVGSVTQSTPAGTETATSPGLSQTGLQSTVFASSVSASSLSSLTSLASSVSASGTSSTTASASSARCGLVLRSVRIGTIHISRPSVLMSRGTRGYTFNVSTLICNRYSRVQPGKVLRRTRVVIGSAESPHREASTLITFNELNRCSCL
ncbi:hypothetical protein LENED_006402 [Lentinula edodes]|uniref:Uncharacterized protein n=1 Tax=Lentinula edodes TaxID=5353 RepID=A0A1Q3EBJ3_LENED|nr:hypothetical protein LENED_006402 [Lentinula edodes]